MVEAEIAPQLDFGGAQADRRERRVEDYPAEPVAPAFSDQSAQLSLRVDHDSFSDVYFVGRSRAGARIVPICICGHVGTIKFKPNARENSPAPDRVLLLGRRITDFNRDLGVVGADIAEAVKRGTEDGFSHTEVS